MAVKIAKKTTLNKILLEHGKKGELVRLMRSNYPAVKRALDGRVDTDKSRRIRKAAINIGGVLVESNNQ
jgi:hypothetical protein